jgi:hypothetical protein
MGQFTLGIRSLLIKATIFVIMAALLAWALGGTLWPRAETANYEPVSFAGQRWFWKLSVGGSSPDQVRWELMISDHDGENPATFDKRHWSDVAGPVVVGEAIYIGARASMNPNEPWQIERISRDKSVESHAMPDRLAVEQQLARLVAGLTLEELDTIRQERSMVLDPGVKVADKE